MPLHWRHNGHDGVSNHQPYYCFLNCLFRRRSKIISKLRVTGLCAGNSPENVSIWWRHHGISELGRQWFRYWLVAHSTISHYLNQCWVIVSWTRRNTFQWNFNQNLKLFIHENCICKCRLWNDGHFVQGETSYVETVYPFHATYKLDLQQYRCTRQSANDNFVRTTPGVS